MAESPIFRPQKKLKITRSPVEVKLPTSSLSPGQVKSICHLHCVWQNGISVLDTRRKGVGREGRRKVRGRPVSAAFLCFPSEGEHGPQQRWGDKWSSLHRCLSVLPGHLLSPLIFHLLLVLLVLLLPIPVSAHLLSPCLSASHPLFGIRAHTHPSPRSPSKKLSFCPYLTDSRDSQEEKVPELGTLPPSSPTCVPA